MMGPLSIRDWTPPALPEPAPKKRSESIQRRGWMAVRQDRLEVFSASLKAEDEEIKRDIGKLRAHSRHLVKNNPILARYIRLLQVNVVGHTGIQLQCDIRTRAGAPLEKKNSEVETAWNWWCGCCTTDGRSMLDLLQGTIGLEAQDGEVLCRYVYGPSWRCGFALEPIDPDRLDHTYHDAAKRIVMGVEQDGWGRPVAYHLWTQHPDSPGARKRERVPASEILHLFRPQASRQTRGVPWCAPVMLMLSLIGKYWEAEVAAAAHEASRAGFLQLEAGSGIPGEDDRDTPQDMEVGPVTYVGLPPGVTANLPDVKHPNTAFEPFSRAALRLVASGLGVDHASLASDRGDANYGSQRGGLLDSRDNYRVLQAHLVQSFLSPIFERWLAMARLSRHVTYQASPRPSWAARGWDWIDPAKDVKAAIDAINAQIDTRTHVLSQKGRAFRDVMQELADERAFAKSVGVNLESQPAPAPPKPAKD